MVQMFVERMDGQGDAQMRQGVLRQLLEGALKEGLRDPQKKDDISVHIRFVSSAEMRMWYEKGYGTRTVTDVLSFPASDAWKEGRSLKEFHEAPSDLEMDIGSLIVCVEKAQEQAREQGHALQTELAWLVVHGTLHLIGYDHQDVSQELRMRSIEQLVLQRVLGVERHWVSQHVDG